MRHPIATPRQAVAAARTFWRGEAGNVGMRVIAFLFALVLIGSLIARALMPAFFIDPLAFALMAGGTAVAAWVGWFYKPKTRQADDPDVGTEADGD